MPLDPSPGRRCWVRRLCCLTAHRWYHPSLAPRSACEPLSSMLPPLFRTLSQFRAKGYCKSVADTLAQQVVVVPEETETQQHGGRVKVNMCVRMPTECSAVALARHRTVGLRTSQTDIIACNVNKRFAICPSNAGPQYAQCCYSHKRDPVLGCCWSLASNERWNNCRLQVMIEVSSL